MKKTVLFNITFAFSLFTFSALHCAAQDEHASHWKSSHVCIRCSDHSKVRVVSDASSRNSSGSLFKNFFETSKDSHFKKYTVQLAPIGITTAGLALAHKTNVLVPTATLLMHAGKIGMQAIGNQLREPATFAAECLLDMNRYQTGILVAGNLGLYAFYSHRENRGSATPKKEDATPSNQEAAKSPTT